MAWELVRDVVAGNSSSKTNRIDYVVSGNKLTVLFYEDNGGSFIYPQGDAVIIQDARFDLYRYRVTFARDYDGSSASTFIYEQMPNGHQLLSSMIYGYIMTTVERERKEPANNIPTITINTTNNKTLYESDTLDLSGSARDSDNGQIINIRYQINNESSKALGTGISNGADPIVFGKTLTFKLGKLYDGSNAISNALADGVNHTVKVWAEDEKGAKSAEHVRTFQVVANRAPVLTVNPVTTQSGLINFDKLTISGTATDPEGQTLKVKYNVNGGAFTEVHNGQGGSFSFQLPLSQLQTGQNTVIIQAVDSYDYIASKTLNISKTHNLKALLNGVARYKLATPEAGISELVTWVERTIGDLDVSMAASMVTTGQAESFADMTYSNTAPIDDGIEEDEFTLTTTGAKTDVSLKLELSRSSVTSNEMVNRITGTFN